jgi:hypothetical protein
MRLNLSGPQPDSPAHKEIALIAPMRSIQGNPLFEDARLHTNRVGNRNSPARTIEKLLLGDGARDKPD